MSSWACPFWYWQFAQTKLNKTVIEHTSKAALMQFRSATLGDAGRSFAAIPFLTAKVAPSFAKIRKGLGRVAESA